MLLRFYLSLMVLKIIILVFNLKIFKLFILLALSAGVILEVTIGMKEKESYNYFLLMIQLLYTFVNLLLWLIIYKQFSQN